MGSIESPNPQPILTSVLEALFYTLSRVNVEVFEKGPLKAFGIQNLES
jgi:hypothetical protein